MSEEIIKVQIAKVLAGETKAYTYLVEQYKDYVFTIAMTILKNREDAEDVSQDIFIKAFKQLHTFKGDSKFSTWLYTVAFRTAISANRKLKLSVKPIDEYIENTMHADDLTNQLKVLETADQKYYLDKALKLIPELDALVLTLYYLHDNTTEEIETITGFNKATIKVRMHRARKKLAEVLENILPQAYATLK